jgi:hypothetical protein
MKTKLIFILILNCFFCLPAVSQTGFGNIDCGKWVANSKSSPSYRSWLLGFMSGLSAGIATPKSDPLDKINSAEQIYLWMDNYCAKNPLKSVVDGGNSLFYELSVK